MAMTSMRRAARISYYDDSMEEPDTMMASSENYLIPLVLGYFKDRWVFGKGAGRLAVVGERLHGDRTFMERQSAARK